MDNLDEKVIRELLINSRQSYRELARRLNVSTVTIINRIKALEKNRIIKNYTTVLDYSKLGYDLQAVIFIRVAKGKLLEVEKKIASNENVFGLYDITGQFDAVAICRFKNRKSLDDFIKKIQTYEFIERTETHLVLNTIKES